MHNGSCRFIITTTMAEAADEDGECKQSKKTTAIGEKVVPIHKQISDVGQYSYAALCATALRNLFDSECHRKFIEETLAVILISLEQPQQVCESVQAMVLGHGMDDMDPYVDVLLAEPCLSDSREPIVSQLLAISIGQGCYDSRMRVLIKHVAWRLRTNWDALEDIESVMSESLAFAQYEMSTEDNSEEKEEKARKAKRRTLKRFALIGLATVGGGTLIGLTGGLAAPLVAAGAGAIIGGTGAAVLGSATGVALIGSLFGVAGAGLTGYKMKRRVGAIEEFDFEALLCGNNLRVENLSSQLHITIAVTGWLSNSMRDFRQPWKHLAESREQYTLRWETKYLVQLGEALDYIFNSAMAVATQEALKYTVLHSLLAAVAWPTALISAAGIIDNPWSVALVRSQSAGRMLAEVLLGREQGKRPVTLIGYSLGARVIFSCIEELSKRKGAEGIVEDVILLGTPATGDPAVWASFKPVVAGKIVNGYCRGDWLLKFLYRTASVQMSIAGLRPVQWSDRRMHNIDLSDVVTGHMDYRNQLDIIMKAVGVRTRDDVSSSRRKSSKLSPDSDDYDLAAGDISSSDDDLLNAPETSSGPLILEDYTSQGICSQTGSVASGSTIEDPHRGNVPESASFDSGVDIQRAESEPKEKPIVTSTTNASSRTSRAGDTDPEKSLQSESPHEVPDEKDAAQNISGTYQSKAEEISNAATASAGSDYPDNLEDSEWSILAASSLDDEPAESAQDMVSNLKRKKLFDSMYRLVMDDDLAEIMGEDDDYQGALLSSDEDEADKGNADIKGS